jgi:hypothetical protein
MPPLVKSLSPWTLDGRLNISLWMSSIQRHLGKHLDIFLLMEDVYDYIRTTEEVLRAIMMVTVLPWTNWLLQT